MTDNEIIKALECCKTGNCDEGCPFYGVKEDCEAELPEEALNVINRQQAEIERYKGVIKLLENDVQTAKAEAVKEFAEKITEVFMRYAHLHIHADLARRDEIESLDGKKIEMQSVWDVLTLRKYEMAEYEEMSKLQHNIEYIANDRLLTELEKDFHLLVKEMTEQSTGYGSSKTEQSTGYGSSKTEGKAMYQEAIRYYEYGIKCDIFQEPVLTYAKLAVEALKERIKKEAT